MRWPEVLNVVDLPDPVPGDGEQLYEVSDAGINVADTDQSQSGDIDQERRLGVTRREAGRSPRR
jgi:NADPH:quinone reductase-like Zn-dependent oxidoreductase